jgi:hypothetical protein
MGIFHHRTTFWLNSIRLCSKYSPLWHMLIWSSICNVLTQLTPLTSLMEPEVWLLRSHKPTLGPISSQVILFHTLTYYSFKIPFNISLPSKLNITYLTQLILLDLITLIMYHEEHKLWRLPLRIFLHLPVTFSLLSPSVLFSTLFPNTRLKSKLPNYFITNYFKVSCFWDTLNSPNKFKVDPKCQLDLYRKWSLHTGQCTSWRKRKNHAEN